LTALKRFGDTKSLLDDAGKALYVRSYRRAGKAVVVQDPDHFSLRIHRTPGRFGDNRVVPAALVMMTCETVDHS